MALKIRLARGGVRKRPFYRVVVADSRSPRDGAFLEKLGTYNPLLPGDNDSRVTFVAERVQYWLSVGAKPSPRVAVLLGTTGLLAKPAIVATPKKSAPGKRAMERLKLQSGSAS